MLAHHGISCSNIIPDYLIYDEMRRRRRQERSVVERLEMPLYRPGVPLGPTEPEVEDESGDSREWIWGDEGAGRDGDRGVHIIDMVDMVELYEESEGEDN